MAGNSRALLAGAVVLSVLAGCMAPAVAPSPRADEARAASPTACDAPQPALAADGGLVGGDIGGCLFRPGFQTAEPTLGLTESGALFLYAMAREASRGLGSTAEPKILARSIDGGRTWSALTPDLAGQPTHRDTWDPYLYVDPATSRIFVDDLQANLQCSMLSWSDDDGATWGHAVAGCMGTDQQTYAAGPPVSSVTRGYANVVYRCAQNGGANEVAATMTTCQRSLDGGQTWLPPGAPAFVADPSRRGHLDLPGACGGAPGHIVVDERGVLYVPRGWCGEPWLAWSADEGATWQRARVSDLGVSRAAYNAAKLADSGAQYGVRSWQTGVGVDSAGNIYYGWVARDRLPYLAISRDGGTTWSAPRMVGPPGLREATLPTLVVGGVGRVAMAYVGSVNAPGVEGDPEPDCLATPARCVLYQPTPQEYASATWNGYITATLDALAPQPRFLTASVNPPDDPLVRGYCGTGCSVEYDFLDLKIGPDGTPWASFVDGCVDACSTGETMENNARDAVVGRLTGLTLWDAEDPNGPYP